MLGLICSKYLFLFGLFFSRVRKRKWGKLQSVAFCCGCSQQQAAPAPCSGGGGTAQQVLVLVLPVLQSKSHPPHVLWFKQGTEGGSLQSEPPPSSHDLGLSSFILHFVNWEKTLNTQTLFSELWLFFFLSFFAWIAGNPHFWDLCGSTLHFKLYTELVNWIEGVKTN